MKKLLTLLLAGAWASGVFGALQYQLISAPGAGQGWVAARQFTLEITSGGSLWLSRFIDNWNGPIIDFATKANMTADNYGVTNTATGVTTLGTGESETITFTNPTNPSQSNSVQAYYVGDFESGEVLSFWLTTLDGRLAYSTGPVGGDNAAASRQTWLDPAGNPALNFSGGMEFIFAGGESRNAPSGQPLPGVLATLLLGSGALVLYRRRKSKTA